MTERERAQMLREEGWTYEAIATQLGYSISTIYGWTNLERDRRVRWNKVRRAMAPRYGAMTYGLFPLWKVTLDVPHKIPWIYVMAPEKGTNGLSGVRAAVGYRLARRWRITSVEKVSDHPIMRGDEYVDKDGVIQMVRAGSAKAPEVHA